MAETRDPHVQRDRPLGPEGRSSAPPPLDRRRLALVAGGFALVLGCVLVLGLMSAIVLSRRADALDTAATPFLHGLASPALDAVANTASFIGTDIVLAVGVALLALVLVVARRRREAVFLAVAIAGSVLVNGAMKGFFHRARPTFAWAHVPSDYSFPSGHAMNSLSVALAIAVVAWQLGGRRAGLIAAVLGIGAALVIGASRVYLGVHFLTDVIGGYAAAVLWVALVAAAFRPAGRRAAAAAGASRP